MDYKEYQHVVKLDDPEVEGLLVGKCYIFPKIDGTNASVWCKDAQEVAQTGNLVALGTGSRRRDLSKEGVGDNAGFRDAIQGDERYIKFFKKYPYLRLYGEWLVPHTLKTYRDDAWRKFYVFDVVRENDTYVPYEEYKVEFDVWGIDYIPPIKIITDPTHDQLLRCVETNTFLIKENSGVGEGVVIKNYDFVNKFGRIKWGKIVRNEFKDKLHKEQGSPEMVNHLIEKEMVDKFLTKEIVDKIYATIIIDQYGVYPELETTAQIIDEFHTDKVMDKKYIPRLLEQSYYDFVREEIWSMVKYIGKNKIRGIDFKNLKQHSFNKVKEYYPQLFRRTPNEEYSKS